MYYSLYHILMSTLVGPVMHNFVDACGRTPARTQPRPQTTSSSPSPATASPTPVTPGASHMQQCTAAEEQEAACLNGKCYAIDLSGVGNRSAFCHCPEYYKGPRCEELTDFFVLYAGEVKKAGIAAGVVILVIILTIIIVYFAVKRSRKRRKRQQERCRQQDGQMNGNAAQPLMKEPVMETERIALNGLEKAPETNV